jgi:hypothetical protein
MNRARARLATVLALLGVGAAQAGAAPAPGTYEARLCVTLAAAAPTCGPAQAQWSGSRLQLRVSDIEYRLKLQARRERGRLEMLLMHGTMQIDAFSADYEWAGSGLQFDDADKKTRYEVQLGERLRAAK